MRQNNKKFDGGFIKYFQRFVRFMDRFLTLIWLNRSCYVLVKLTDFWYTKLCTEMRKITPRGVSPVRCCVSINEGRE